MKNIVCGMRRLALLAACCAVGLVFFATPEVVADWTNLGNVNGVQVYRDNSTGLEWTTTIGQVQLTCPTFGGQMDLSIGKDKSSGKLALFPSGTEKVKPPAPSQSIAAASSSIAYDDTTISAANVSALPVMPSYD